MTSRIRHLLACALAFAAATVLSARRAEAQSAPDQPPEGPRGWIDSIAFGASVDSYFAVNYRFPVPQAPGSTARAYDAYNGFNVAAVGLDASHEPDPVGGTIQLRFGANSASAFAGADNNAQLQYVKQAFGQWRPGGSDGNVTLDVGKFDTPYGAEVFNSWENMSYTRGALYWLGQPIFHVGARATWQITETLNARLLVVNGWSQNVDVNVGKSLGVQLNYAHDDDVALSLGWYGGPDQPDSYVVDAADGTPTRYHLGSNNKRFRHLVDLVAKVQPVTRLTLLFNADYGTERVVTDPVTVTSARMSWYGAMLALRYAFDDTYAVALRGEYYADPQGYTFAGYAPNILADGSMPDYKLETGTLTLEALPTPNLIVRLDTRVDAANEKIFLTKVRDGVRTQVTSTLGLVFRTD